MPMIMVMPIMADMLSSVPVIQRPMKTADTETSDVARIASERVKLSKRNKSSKKTSAVAAANTCSRPLNATCCC